MLDAKVSELLNNQINKEFYSAYFYLDILYYYQKLKLSHVAHLFKIHD